MQAREPLGRRRWAIPEGYLPPGGLTGDRALASHEAACILNAGPEDAHVEITVFFADRAPAGPYRISVAARRTRHLRFDDLTDPERIPRGVDYSAVIESDVPVVVQHTRLDSRRPEVALLSTIAWSDGGP
jgi:hypothetical protein